MKTAPVIINAAPELEVKVVLDQSQNFLVHEASPKLKEISAMTLITKRLVLMMTIISLTTSRVIRML